MNNKYLRIGLVINGHLFGEKIMTEPRDITIGVSSRADFVIPIGQDTPLAMEHGLFMRTDKGFVLRATAEMTGRLVESNETPRQITDLFVTADRMNGFYQIPLGLTARGQIKIGFVTILFQVVEYTPPAERAHRGLGHTTTAST